MDPKQEFPLHEDEELHVATDTDQGLIAVTDRRLIVKHAERIALDLPLEDIRRIQFDVERARPATLVVVPHSPSHPPEVMSVPVERLEPVSRMVYIIGDRLGRLD
jgi:hypothetical protein